VSVGAHGAILALLLWPRPEPPQPVEPPPTVLALIQPTPETPRPAPATPVPAKQPVATRQPAAVQPAPHPAARKPAHVSLHAAPARPAPETPSEDSEAADDAPAAELSDADLAGAVSADAGPAGGVCDMARRVQAALRKDALVRSAVTQSGLAAGKALLVWNGDWVRSHGEDGKGLSAVREAIAWEVGFAPAACRAEHVRGLILFSLGAAPGSIRLALGSAAGWRWSDLLK
jgi:hypothetical protein